MCPDWIGGLKGFKVDMIWLTCSGINLFEGELVELCIKCCCTGGRSDSLVRQKAGLAGLSVGALPVPQIQSCPYPAGIAWHLQLSLGSDLAFSLCLREWHNAHLGKVPSFCLQCTWLSLLSVCISLHSSCYLTLIAVIRSQALCTNW